jgi:hypothetical protein
MEINNLVLYPGSDGLHDGQAISDADYITLSVRSACLDPKEFPDNWFQKNTITFSVAVQIGGKSLTFPIYSDYSAGAATRLAINQYMLLSDAPCNGSPVGISAQVFRSDKNDFLPTLIQLLSGAKQDAALSTFAMNAIPAIELAGTVASKIYTTFAQHSQKIVETTSAALQVGAQGENLLRNCFVLLYSGPGTMDGSQLTVTENGDVYWKGTAPNPLRSGSWVLFQILSSPKRADQHNRKWDQLFIQSIREFSGLPGTDPSKAEKEFTDAMALLENDSDITDSNQDSLIDQYGDAFVAAKTAHTGGNVAPVQSALQSSKVLPAQAQAPGPELHDSLLLAQILTQQVKARGAP